MTTSKTSSLARKPSEAKTIHVRGAREHNLKNVDLEIPRDALEAFLLPLGQLFPVLALAAAHDWRQQGQADDLIGMLPKPVYQLKMKQIGGKAMNEHQ